MKTNKPNFTVSENFRVLREQAGFTLSRLAELSGYSIAAINALENRNEGSKRLRDKVLSLLLQKQEEGAEGEAAYWRDRAIKAEEKLKMLKKSMAKWLDEL